MQWRIEQPTSLDLEGVRSLEVRLAGGRVDVVGRVEDAESGAARVEVSGLKGPLLVSLVDGTLTVAHERLTWGGLFDWVSGRRTDAVVSVSVPASCAVRLGVVSADAVVSGVASDWVSLKSVSGDVVLDGVSSVVSAQTVSGSLESRRITGDLTFSTVSGDLSVAGGSTGRLHAQTVSGDVTLDLDLRPGGDYAVNTVSGDLVVRVPPRTDLEVDVESTSGSLQASFAGLTHHRKPGKAKLFGSVGDGGGRFRARTVSGDVTLLARVPS